MTPQDVDAIKGLVDHVAKSVFWPALILLIIHHVLVYLRGED